MNGDSSVAALFVVFVLCGVSVLYSYYCLLRFYQNTNNAVRENIWAQFNSLYWFYAWIFSAIVSAVCFVWFSVALMIKYESLPNVYLFILPYATFLIASLLYSWLLLVISEFRKPLIILDLFVVAVSMILVSVWSEINLGSSDNSYDKLCAFLPIWVAIHCTVFDLCIWGYTWKGPAPKNTGMKSAFQCPTITKPTMHGQFQRVRKVGDFLII